MKHKQSSRSDAAVGYQVGDLVRVERLLPHFDPHTPGVGAICRVTRLAFWPGNRHPIHLTEIGDSRREDWFNVTHISPLDEDMPQEGAVPHA
ncbi:MAG: hypothetical protein DDT21_00346 [Syntrophomonadaceae bacterium]|nr:hypothetical protein [Bacillota bacterium]